MRLSPGRSLGSRIPFSSLRCDGRDAEEQAWRFMLYRNYPREFRYQYSSSPLPRDVSCFSWKSSSFSGFAVFAYELNQQTVLFVGYGDDRELNDLDELEPSARQLFLKLSCAFQR